MWCAGGLASPGAGGVSALGSSESDPSARNLAPLRRSTLAIAEAVLATPVDFARQDSQLSVASRNSSGSAFRGASLSGVIKARLSAAAAVAGAILAAVVEWADEGPKGPPCLLVVDSEERPRCDGVYRIRKAGGKTSWKSQQGQWIYLTDGGHWMVTDDHADTAADVGWIRGSTPADGDPDGQRGWVVMGKRDGKWKDADGTAVLTASVAAALSQREWDDVRASISKHHGTVRAAHGNILEGQRAFGRKVGLQALRTLLSRDGLGHLALSAALRVTTNLRAIPFRDWLQFEHDAPPEPPSLDPEREAARAARAEEFWESVQSVREAQEVVSLAASADVRRKSEQVLEAARRRGAKMSVGSVKEVSLRDQADESMLEVQKLLEREAACRSPEVQAAAKDWWRRMPKNQDGVVDFARYRWMCYRTHAALVGGDVDEDFEKGIKVDWYVDRSGSKTLDETLLVKCIVGMVDMWCEEPSAEAYSAFLSRLCREHVLPPGVAYTREDPPDTTFVELFHTARHGDACQLCQKVYGVFVHRTKCRKCGASVCQQCAKGPRQDPRCVSCVEEGASSRRPSAAAFLPSYSGLGGRGPRASPASSPGASRKSSMRSGKSVAVKGRGDARRRSTAAKSRRATSKRRAEPDGTPTEICVTPADSDGWASMCPAPGVVELERESGMAPLGPSEGIAGWGDCGGVRALSTELDERHGTAPLIPSPQPYPPPLGPSAAHAAERPGRKPPPEPPLQPPESPAPPEPSEPPVRPAAEPDSPSLMSLPGVELVNWAEACGIAGKPDPKAELVHFPEDPRRSPPPPPKPPPKPPTPPPWPRSPTAERRRLEPRPPARPERTARCPTATPRRDSALGGGWRCMRESRHRGRGTAGRLVDTHPAELAN
eukprot:TRINITY_DN29740_c0_g1_i1.p1 TRINITY_DN29740_c0_g1~~TRINITY_DN29740_c0_g1_i1.p1  ORF type:complete len:887 (+),score=211.77 TRINITY_DN29740_c0_g1_i1:50-2710(+)